MILFCVYQTGVAGRRAGSHGPLAYLLIPLTFVINATSSLRLPQEPLSCSLLFPLMNPLVKNLALAIRSLYTSKA